MSSKLDKNGVILALSISFICVQVQQSTSFGFAIFNFCQPYFKADNTIELLCLLVICRKHGPKNDLHCQLAY
jgi:hypothetical protein